MQTQVTQIFEIALPIFRQEERIKNVDMGIKVIAFIEGYRHEHKCVQRRTETSLLRGLEHIEGGRRRARKSID